MKSLFTSKKGSRKDNDHGNAIVLVMLVMALLTPAVAVTFELTEGRAIAADRTKYRDIADQAALGALDYAFSEWKGWIKVNGGRLPTVSQCAGATPTIGVNKTEAQGLLDASKAFKNAVLTNLSVTPIDRLGVDLVTGMTSGAEKSAMLVIKVPNDEKNSKRIARSYQYRAVARVFVPVSKGTRGSVIKAREPGNSALSVLADNIRYVESHIQRLFSKEDISLWQAMMWYDGDLELFPTPQMNIYGWIHTNSNAYLAHASGNNFTLNILSDFTFHGSPDTIKRDTGRTVLKDAQGLIYGVSYNTYAVENHWGTYEDPIWAGGGYNAQVSQSDYLSPIPNRTLNTDTADANQNNDGMREIIERPVDMDNDGKRTDDDAAGFSDQRYYNVADIKIIVNRTAASTADRVKILDINEDPITDATLVSEIKTKVLGVGSDGLPSTKDFFDYREAGNITSDSSNPATPSNSGYVTMTNINVAQLTPLLNNYSGYKNGVVYFKDETAGGTPTNSANRSKKAARLYRGGTLPNIGMTFVSEDGVYVHGDYNTGSTYSTTPANGVVATGLATQPAANTVSNGTLGSNVVGTYFPKPAAVVGDAVMFLSNAWSESYGTSTGTTSRVASATTYNTAFLAGHVPTATDDANDTQRSGGAINFPRVLEAWNDRNFTYYGSMIQMFNSTVFTTPWSHLIYKASSRMWNFQDDFLYNPPPGPLAITEYSRGRFTRE